MSSLRKGDVGTVLRYTVSEDGGPVDVSAATVKQLKLTKPDGTQVTKTLVNSTKSTDKKDGTDGRVEYVTVAGDINLKGTYKWQLFFNLASWNGNSLQGTFVVEDTLF